MTITHSRGRIVSASVAAQMLGVTTSVLSHYREQRRGPQYLKFGKSVRYFEADLIRFAERMDGRSDQPVGRTMRPAEVADYLSISLSTLCDLRESNEGPRYVRRGRLIEYREIDVEDYLANSLHLTRSY